MANLSFDGRVNIASRIVTEKYPQAKLYEADGVATRGPTVNPEQIDRLRVVFQNPDNTTVMIKETAYGEFGAPVLYAEPWLGDLAMPWPIKMDLPEANALKEEAGFKEAYTTVTLRNPLGPGKTNPCFIFGDGGQKFVFVDATTGKVHQTH